MKVFKNIVVILAIIVYTLTVNKGFHSGTILSQGGNFCICDSEPNKSPLSLELLRLFNDKTFSTDNDLVKKHYVCVNSNLNVVRPVRVGVLFDSLNNLYMIQIKRYLEDIQMNNKEKVEFTFYDGKYNKAIQDATINQILKSESSDMLFVNLVDTGPNSVRNLIDTVKPYVMPVVLFSHVNPEAINIIKAYNKAVVVSSDPKEASDLLGKFIIDSWKNDKTKIDKNKDDILQYIVVRGGSSPYLNRRVEYALSKINEAGIKTEELASVNAQWNKELAKEAVDSLFLRYNGKIEAILSNNDAMAIGAVEALQKYGYNSGNPSKQIIVTGIDGIPEARELIEKGNITATIAQDLRSTAEAIYTVGMNLYNKGNSFIDTNYKIAPNGVEVLIPYKVYTKQ